MNLQVGRDTPCAPSRFAAEPGAHGVSRPTTAGFRGSKREISFGRILSPATPPLGEEREKRQFLPRFFWYATALPGKGRGIAGLVRADYPAPMKTACVGFALVVAALVVGAGCEKKASQPAPPGSHLETPAPTAVAPKPEYQKLLGKWQRPDGGYVIELRTVNAEGKFEAGYFNPAPIHIERALAFSEGGKLKVFVLLQDANYPGCTYKLTYDPQADQLFGEYFQATMQETYAVTFARLP
jgi:hypothetical protein